MPTFKVRTYPERATVWRACLFLMEEGVLARPLDVQLGVMPGLDRDQPFYEHWVTVAFKQDTDHALALLDVFDETPPPDHEEWAHQAEPDLTRLPADLPVPCAGCRYDLRPLIRSPEPVVCPECGRSNDPVDRVLTRHGPEAMIDCYHDDEPPDPEWSEEAVLKRLQLPCPHCACPLHGLDVEGACPACGRSYNKISIVRHAFESL